MINLSFSPWLTKRSDVCLAFCLKCITGFAIVWATFKVREKQQVLLKHSMSGNVFDWNMTSIAPTVVPTMGATVGATDGCSDDRLEMVAAVAVTIAPTIVPCIRAIMARRVHRFVFIVRSTKSTAPVCRVSSVCCSVRDVEVPVHGRIGLTSSKVGIGVNGAGDAGDISPPPNIWGAGDIISYEGRSKSFEPNPFKRKVDKWAYLYFSAYSPPLSVHSLYWSRSFH